MVAKKNYFDEHAQNIAIVKGIYLCKNQGDKARIIQSLFPRKQS